MQKEIEMQKLVKCVMDLIKDVFLFMCMQFMKMFD